MKSIERHKLKENEFAHTIAQAREVLDARKRTLTTALLALAVAVVAIGGFLYWRSTKDVKANEMLASAIAIYDAPVVPLAAPAPGSPAPLPQPGTFTTEQEKLQAALPKFREAASRYPNAEAGMVAKFHLAGILAALGQYAEAEQNYQEVVNRGGGTIYGRTAKLGLADAQVAQGKYDPAITIYTEMSRDTASQIPVDSVLMQLGRAYLRAGRKEEAARTFDRVVQEFPTSTYAADAKRELETARKS
jgi:tetratricopeptide (TPR) repeat protein